MSQTINTLYQVIPSKDSRITVYSPDAIFAMISDDDLYRLAIFLGSVAMVLIVLYHFFEVNSQDSSALAENAAKAAPAQQSQAVGKQSGTSR
ncbi:Oligosaccaryltransferase-domain-containing protein [Xylariaceae sp. FL0662B]|nr:Oligosaccaryltransferase-domain-containing protein [Xylariaceae sp. FL0662B]